MIALVMGGSGSGKSAWAERLSARLPCSQKVYLATMQAADGESAARVERHRLQRAGLGFETIERPADVGAVPLKSGSLVLLEDIPNLLANEMFSGGDWRRIVPDIEKLSVKAGHLLLVTGCVFSDGVRYDPETQRYLSCLARINAELAALADVVTEIICGIPVAVKGELPCS